MSRTRVVTGADDRGRPIATWADPEAPRPGYGHMEPAMVSTIERRRATPAELEAARAREAAPSHLTVAGGGLAKRATGPHIATAEHMQQSRMRGAARHVEVVAASKSTPARRDWNGHAPKAPAPAIEEETTVEDAGQDLTAESPTDPVYATLAILTDAVVAAAEAWTEKLQAEALVDQANLTWLQARAALDAAYRALEAPPQVEHIAFAEAPAGPDPDIEAAKANIIRTLREAAAAADKLTSTDDVNPEPIGGGPAPRRNVREPRTEGLTTRQAKAIELMQGGKTRADIARAMGTTYQTVDGLFEAAAKKGLLPIELIPLLPARFAKYTGV